MEILTQENLVGAKVAPTAASRTLTPALKLKPTDLGVGGWKNVPVTCFALRRGSSL